jgi:AbrB family looped-hinge helix DNA binding protein
VTPEASRNTPDISITIAVVGRINFMQNVTTLTSKGQVTIPKAIRDELGLQPFDKIRFDIEDGEVKLKKAYPSLREIAGSIPSCDIPMEEWDDIIADDRAQAYREKSG